MKKLLPLVFLLCFSACKSTRVNGTSYQPDPALNDLAVYAISLEGTPYRYGGTSPDTGFDCSGFVGHVFKQSLGKNLPRSSEQISRMGIEQESDELQSGDLVFFNTLNRSYSHVGIYLGDGQFIHAPSSGKFVSIANMHESYWRKRYNGARRVGP